MEAAIELRNITKKFGQTTAVDNLNLVVPRGGLYGFIGPNGAGKTTAIRIIMSILFPDSGDVLVLGHASALEAKNRIGYLPEERGVYRKMRVGAFLEYMGQLKGCTGPDLGRRISALLKRVGLDGTERQRCEELSKGMLQKVQFLAAMLHQPDLLILDEPFSGLDPVSRRLLRDLVLEENRRGATVLFSTHVMPQAEEICQHVVMIHHGRKVLDEKLASIQGRYDPRTIEIDPLDREAAVEPIGRLPGVERVDRSDSGYQVLLAPGTDPALAMHRILDAVRPARMQLSRPRLEDIFIQLVSSSTDAGEDRHRLRADLADAGPGEASA
jgi:ABC-2 type transport system ATP-binding protein